MISSWIPVFYCCHIELVGYIFEGGESVALSAIQLWEFQGLPKEDISFLTCSPRGGDEAYVVLGRLTSLSCCGMVIVYIMEYCQKEQ